jgi:hypothetical protein
VLINEVYGGGGNSGSIYKNDFIELYNPTSSAIILSGWSIQYLSATGTGTWQTSNLTGVINANSFFLIQGAQGSGGTTYLPTADFISTLTLSATNGKIALVNNTTAFIGACPPNTSIIDLVGYGNANCFEGTAIAALSNTTSAVRKTACVDTNNNANDFKGSQPTPQNSSSSLSAVNFTTGYPTIKLITASGFQFVTNLTDAGTTYFVILPTGATPPTGSQIKNGQDAAGNNLLLVYKGSLLVNTSGTEVTSAISNLTASKDYDIYFVNERCVLSSPKLIQITTLAGDDTSPPSNSAGYPKIQNTSSSGFQLITNLSESGKTYYVVLPNSASAPTANQVKMGLDFSGEKLPTNLSGSILVSTPGNEYTALVSGLSTSSDYSVYILSEDSKGNSQTVLEQLDVSTLQEVLLDKLDQTIIFNLLPSKQFGDKSFKINASATSGLPVLFTSSDESVANLKGDSIIILKSGTTNILATQTGSDVYKAAETSSQVLIINKASQSVLFENLSSKTYGELPFTLSATSSSGLPVSYSSADTTITYVKGAIVIISKSGNVKITATQSGNENYKPAPSVVQTLVINKSKQTISFNLIKAKTFGDSAFVLSATSSSGMPVTFESSDTTVASINGKTLHILKAGTTEIEAQQTGNENYYSAATVSQSLTINKASQRINFSALSDRRIGDHFNLTATSSSKLAISFSTKSSKISLSGDSVTLLSAGRTIITANQKGNENYHAAISIDRTFCIRPATPQIKVTSGLMPTLTSSSNSGNQWFLNGNSISGSITNTFAANTSGIYKVQVAVDDCLSDFSTEVPVVITGLADLASTITIYPNPVEDRLIVDGLNPETTECEIIDILGRVSNLRLNFREDKHETSVENFSPGQYVIRIQQADKVLRFALLKK